MKFLGIIPARYASTRFPGKPLADIGGKMMIQRVFEQVKTCLDEVYVATDDERIATAVRGFGGQVVMTSHQHRSGTDRCLEAVQIINGDFDVVINIQGDEPFIHPEQIEGLKDCFISSETEIATLIKPITSAVEITNINRPKVVINQNQEAMYFSRSAIPFVRDSKPEEWINRNTFYSHIGMYAYRYDILLELTKLPTGILEKAESLEQLRWLENGYRIKTAQTQFENIGIDTPEDLVQAQKSLLT